jgi:hypothetical protein
MHNSCGSGFRLVNAVSKRKVACRHSARKSSRSANGFGIPACALGELAVLSWRGCSTPPPHHYAGGGSALRPLQVWGGDQAIVAA